MSEPARARLAAIAGELRALTAELATRWSVPGVLVGCVDGSDEIVLAHGVSDVTRRTPLKPDAIFPFASLSKVVTGTTVLTAVAAGVVELDEPIGRLDEIAGWHRPDLTLGDLLSHTTGWAEDDLRDHGDGDDVRRRAMHAIAVLGDDPATRRHWSYSNAAMNAAAYVLERRTAEPYERLARRSVLDAIGMRGSSFVGEAEPPVEPGHILEAGGPVPSRPARLFRAMNTYGGLVGPIGDVLALARAHFDGYDAMRAPRTRSPGSHEAAGLTWWVRDVAGTPVVSHGGRARGHMPLLVLVPERRFALAIAANCGGSAAARLCHEVAGWVLERVVGLRESAPPRGKADARELAGRYARDGVTREVTARAGAFELREWADGEPRPEDGWPLTPTGGDQVVVGSGPLAGLRADFLRGSDDRIAALRFERTGLGWVHFGGRVIPRVT